MTIVNTRTRICQSRTRYIRAVASLENAKLRREDLGETFRASHDKTTPAFQLQSAIPSNAIYNARKLPKFLNSTGLLGHIQLAPTVLLQANLAMDWNSVFELKGPPQQAIKTPGSLSIKITRPVLKTWRFVEVEERPKWVATTSECENTVWYWYWNTWDDDFPVEDGLSQLLNSCNQSALQVLNWLASKLLIGPPKKVGLLQWNWAMVGHGETWCHDVTYNINALRVPLLLLALVPCPNISRSPQDGSCCRPLQHQPPSSGQGWTLNLTSWHDMIRHDIGCTLTATHHPIAALRKRNCAFHWRSAICTLRAMLKIAMHLLSPSSKRLRSSQRLLLSAQWRPKVPVGISWETGKPFGCVSSTLE